MAGGVSFETPGFLVRFGATSSRVLGALLAVGVIALGAELGDRHALADLIDPWLLAASRAIGVGAVTSAFFGLVRLVMRAAPGDARDPLRQLARLLVRGYRPVGAALVLAATACAVVGFFVEGELGGYARCAALLLAFVALRARALPWFAGVRHAADGRVRFASARVHPFTGAFIALLLFLGGFALLPLLRFAAVPLTVALVLGWLTWSLSLAHVTVGKDGVQVTRWRDTFYPYAGGAAKVDGTRLLVVDRRAARSLPFAPMGAAGRRLLAARIDALLAATDDAPERTEVSGDELAATLASLDGAAGYRVAEVPRETLWRIVEARSVAAPVRVRAAELVAAEPQEDDLPRLRRLAEDLAEPGTSEAIARVARR